MKVLFGLRYDDYGELPEYKLFPYDVNNSYVKPGILECVIQEILRKHIAFQPILSADANKATRREFISAIIYGVVSNFNGTVKICPGYQVSGCHGKGPIDWVIKVENTIICVVIICLVEENRNIFNDDIG
jgi:hypothetical protein